MLNHYLCLPVPIGLEVKKIFKNVIIASLKKYLPTEGIINMQTTIWGRQDIASGRSGFLP